MILSTGKWPHFLDIINATDHDIRDHPWFQLGKPQKKVDKGKRRAVELAGDNAVAGPSGVKEMEGQSRRGQVGEPRETEDSQAVPAESRPIKDDEVPRGRSRSRKPRKCAQLVATINSDSDDEPGSLEPRPKRPRPNVCDMQKPEQGYEWVDDKDRCIKCIQRDRRCVANPGHACWQCCCSKVGCSMMTAVRVRSRSRSQAPRKPAPCQRSPSAPSTLNPRKSQRAKRQRQTLAPANPPRKPSKSFIIQTIQYYFYPYSIQFLMGY